MQKINIGDRFGRLVVLRETTKEERKNPAGRNYECQCDCGNKVIVYGHNLKTGNTKSCGCLSRETASLNNAANIQPDMKFHKLTVIQRAPLRSNHKAYWVCQCECGNTIEVNSSDLLNNKVKSCGCLKMTGLINEIGHVYGLLTVLSYAGSAPYRGGALWECECQCGNRIIVRGDSLRNGHTTSCGCRKSKKEEEINLLLNKYHIIYSTQYCFPDLQTNKGGFPRFDFVVYNHDNSIKYLIEYQGSQHTDPQNNWYSDEYHQRDLLKQQYCNEHNLQLLLWDRTTDIEKEIQEKLL